MRLLRLQLADYRNFHRLDLTLGPGASVFIGANAQGKTNLLESIYLLATMKELRAEREAQVIRREVAAGPIPAARVLGEGETAAGPLKVEVAVVGREGGSGLIASKTVKVNGVPKRLSDAVGRLTAVLFTAADIDLISGAPSARRRYIDITLSQVDSRYVVARSRPERVIAPRNHLLKRMREGLAQGEELSFLDPEPAPPPGPPPGGTRRSSSSTISSPRWTPPAAAPSSRPFPPTISFSSPPPTWSGSRRASWTGLQSSA